MYVRVGLIGLGLALLLGACGEATPDEVRDRTEPIITRVIKQVEDSLAAAQEMNEVKQLLDSLELVLPSVADDTLKADDWSEMSADELAQQVNEQLGQYVFTESNVESASPDSVTFLLRGGVLCQGVKVEQCTFPATGGEPSCSTSEEATQGCIEAVDRLALRIKATLVGSDGVDLGFRVADSPTVITLRLRSDRVTVELSLAGAGAAARAIAELADETIELPATMTGVVTASLVLNGPGDISLQSAVTRAVHVEGNTDQGKYRVKVAAQDPTTEIRLRQSPPSISFDVDWGTVEALLPAREVWEQASGSLELVLKGLSAQLSSDGQGGLSIKNLGLGQGTSALRLDGKPLLQVDLNPANNRRLDLTLTPWQGELPRCEVSPLMDLRVQVSLAPVEPWLEEPLEPWARNESYTVKLDGNAPAVLPLRESATSPGGLKVLQGLLTLQTQVQPAQVSVPAGSCLRILDEAPVGSHPLLGRLISEPCP